MPNAVPGEGGVLALLNPLRLYGDLWRQRGLVRQLAVRYFDARTRGTYLGIAWSVMLPIALLGIYTFVFNVIFTVRWGMRPDESRFEFALMLFCGMVVYGVFSESTVRAASLVVDNPNYVKKIVFPVEMLPVASLGSSLLNAAVSLLLLLVASALVLRRVPPTIVLLPLVVAPLVGFSLGVSWLVAALGVFVRDISNVTAILVQQMLFFLTPIFYRLENIPEPYRSVAAWNPMTGVVENARRTLLLGEAPAWGALAWGLVASLAVMQLGYAWFMRSKPAFADVL